MRFRQVFWCLDRLVVDYGPFFESQSDRYPVVFGGDCHDGVASGLATVSDAVALVLVVACLNVRIVLGVGRWASSVEVLWMLMCVGGRSEQRSANLAAHLPLTWWARNSHADILIFKTGVDEFKGVPSECVNMTREHSHAYYNKPVR